MTSIEAANAFPVEGHISLKTYLAQLPKDMDITIGTENGSGFLFFGKASDTQKIIDIFQRAFYGLKDDCEDRKSTLMNMFTEHFDDGWYDPNNVTFAEVRNWADRIKSLLLAIDKNDIYAEKFINPMSRFVCKAYPKEISRTDTIGMDNKFLAIIIKGVENGQFWFEDEYEKSEARYEAKAG